jgi:hypothetical protein
MRLKDKSCIITGGGSGIGRAACLMFAKEGARLVIADKRKDQAQSVADECVKLGAKAIALEVDVTKSADAKRMVDETVKAYGRLDVLLNNAGYGIAGNVVETDEDAWEALDRQHRFCRCGSRHQGSRGLLRIEGRCRRSHACGCDRPRCTGHPLQRDLSGHDQHALL